jgi:hypothetical protein
MSTRPQSLRVTLYCTFAVLSACGDAQGHGRAKTSDPIPAAQYVVGIDISGSRTPAKLAEAKTLLNDLIGRMSYGDRLVLIETYQGGTDEAQQFVDSAPLRRRHDREAPSDKQALEDFREDAVATAEAFFDPARSRAIKSTDILTTVSRAADYARGGGGRRTTLILLSDMLNATRELNMERAGGLPGRQWIDSRRALGNLPNLKGVCVFAVGADVRTQRGSQVRDFWSRYFAASGTTLADRAYRDMISNAAEVTCE